MSTKRIISILTLGLGVFALNASAHINIAKENHFFLGEEPREYIEGSSVFLHVNLSHDCSSEDRTQHFATRRVTMVLPNGEGLPADFQTTDREDNIYPANAMMGTKARQNANWRKSHVHRAPVSPYYSHGVKDEDSRAFEWRGAHVDNDHYDSFEMRTGLPKIAPESCVARLKVYVPTVQYCKRGYKIAWVGTADSKFKQSTKTRLTDDFAASFTVVRSKDNPLPQACGEGEEVEARPSVEDIDKYL